MPKYEEGTVSTSGKFVVRGGQWVPVGAEGAAPGQLPNATQQGQEQHPLAPWANILGKTLGVAGTVLGAPDKYLFEPYVTGPARFGLEKAGVPETKDLPGFFPAEDPTGAAAAGRAPMEGATWKDAPVREILAQAPSFALYPKVFKYAGKALGMAKGLSPWAKMAEAPAAEVAESLAAVNPEKAAATLEQAYEKLSKAGVGLEEAAGAAEKVPVSVAEPAAAAGQAPWMQSLETPTFMRQTMLQPRTPHPSLEPPFKPRTAGPQTEMEAEKWIADELFRRHGPQKFQYGPGRGPATAGQWNREMGKRSRLMGQIPDIGDVSGLARLMQTVRTLGK